MENLSPSRIQPLSPGEEKTSDDPRPRKPAPKPVPATPASQLPAIEDDSDGNSQHKLDERA
jgi:hypothetical protein